MYPNRKKTMKMRPIPLQKNLKSKWSLGVKILSETNVSIFNIGLKTKKNHEPDFIHLGV